MISSLQFGHYQPLKGEKNLILSAKSHHDVNHLVANCLKFGAGQLADGPCGDWEWKG